MKKKNLLLMLLAVMTLLLIPVSVQAAAAKPGTVKLSSIKAVDYNQINIKWKKTSGATNYIVYYREAGSSKWVKVKTLDSTKSSYTHTASSKYPIIVGQKYTYTVKAYNKKTKKYGSYNTKGLTVTASLKMVTGIEAKIEGTTVKLTWNKVSGADKYAIYSKIKAGDKWNKIITIKDTSSFIDVNPCVDCTNYYSVRGYSSSTKTYGVMNKTGERMKAGLQPYKYDLRLEKAAMIRAKEIAVKFSHTRPDGRDSYSAVYEAGVGCPSGENIGMGTTSAEYMMILWMNSTGHQAAILSRSTTHIGVGYYSGHWVQLFSYGPDEKCTFTIDANGGAFEDGASVKSFQFPLKQSHISIYDTFPTPSRNGYKFDGWVTAYGEKYHYVTADRNEKFTASWIPN